MELGAGVSEDLYRALGESVTGYVIAPAGCGKTEAIVRAVKSYCAGKQLVLTHTHAGVGALRKRFKDNDVSSESYHLETISGWTLSWVRHYPQLSGFTGALPVPKNSEWPSIYVAAANLLNNPFVQWVVKNSYAGIIVDEYQDCTLQMHNLILKLKAILACRVLGDPLQAIFGFNEPLGGIIMAKITYAELEARYGEDVANDLLLSIEKLAKIISDEDHTDAETRFQRGLNVLDKAIDSVH
jgi:DNA helicase-2/ATP-dependent DNA helicase PcrA